MTREHESGLSSNARWMDEDRCDMEPGKEHVTMYQSKSCVYFAASAIVLMASVSLAQQTTVPTENQAKIDQAKL